MTLWPHNWICLRSEELSLNILLESRSFIHSPLILSKYRKKHCLLGKPCLSIIYWFPRLILRGSNQLYLCCEAFCVICSVKINLWCFRTDSVKNDHQQEVHTKSKFSLVITRCFLREDTISIYFPTESLLNIAILISRKF